jgi:glycosyltransferase A (GT-A) superfamily protein (DUF2064 family)
VQSTRSPLRRTGGTLPIQENLVFSIPIHFDLFAKHGAMLRDQGAGGLGARMQRVVLHAIPDGDVAIFIGSDCPALTPDGVRSAAKALHQGTDVAHVPAWDGGYVSSAARRCSRHLFDGIAWGTSSVMVETRDWLRDSGRSWQEPGPSRDIVRSEGNERLLCEQPHLPDRVS